MTDIFVKVLAVVIISAIITVLLKDYKSEYAIIFSFCVGVFVILILTKKVFPSIDTLKNLINGNQNSSYCVKAVLKALGITYLSEFCADTCTDFGQSSLAAKAELAGKCAVFITLVPMICKILDFALELCKK